MVTKGKGIPELADKYNILVILPDGGYSSWYFDSPVLDSFQYETHIIEELIPIVDKKYKTKKTKESRAITGLSMGGHGALYLAIRHQDIFGATGSMSGGVDICSFSDRWHIKEKLGNYSKNKELWQNNNVIGQLHKMESNSEKMKIIIDCGADDFFYEVNLNLHHKLLYRNINHDFIIRPGEHNWDYWNNSIKYQFLFFNNYFN